MRRYNLSYRLFESNRLDIKEGNFGAIAPFFCEECTSTGMTGYTWEDPKIVLTHRGCGHESIYGPEEDEYTTYCPKCGSPDSIYDNTGESEPFRAVKRYFLKGKTNASTK